MSSTKTIPRSTGVAPPSRPRTLPPTEGRSDTELIGTLVDGRYQLLELIGRGGMGTVYKAEHVGIRRIVALKRLHPSLAKVPEVSRRFEREAFAIGRIEHPNCVNVSDFGQLDDGSLYLVMEFLEGRSLGDELADHVRIEPRRAMHILRHVLRGLGHAHQNDIVHRDVKPENVLLVELHGDPDFAKILDFGIAKLIGSAAEDDGGVKLTQAGMAFGTPVYMSPEQALGNPVDGRADLYAASVVAYEMITGRPPFFSDDKLEIMSMHTSRPVPPMREIAPEVSVPPEIEQLVVRGLAKRPQERYATADAYIAAIDQLLGQVPGQQVLMLPGGAVPTPYAGTAYASGPVAVGIHDSQAVLTRSPHTSTNTLAPDRPARSKRLLIAGLFAVACAIGVGAAVMRSRASTSPPPAQEPALVEQLSLAEQAAAKLAQGAPKEAIVLLEAKQEAIANDPAALLQLGHAYASTMASTKAIATYRLVLELDGERRTEEKLRANLRAMVDNSSGGVSLGAAEILATYLDDQTAKDKLVALASSHKDNDVRHKAVELVEKFGLSDRVNWLESRVLDLEEGKDCEERRQAVSKLRALGDPSAVSALKKAVERKGRYGKWRRKPINRCLRDEAMEAIQYLESLNAIDAGPGTGGVN